MKKVDNKLSLRLLFVFALAHAVPTIGMDEERALRHGLGQPLLQPVEGGGERQHLLGRESGEGYFVVDMGGVSLEDQQRLGALARLRRRGASARDWFKDNKHFLKTIPSTGAVAWAFSTFYGGIPRIISVEQFGDQWTEWIGDKAQKYKRPALFLGGISLIATGASIGIGFIDIWYLNDTIGVLPAALAVAAVKIAGHACGIRKPMTSDDVENFLRSENGQEIMRAEVGRLLEARGIRDERPLGPFTLVDVVAHDSEGGSEGPSSDTTLGSSPRQEQLAAGVLAAAQAAEQVQVVVHRAGDDVRSEASLSVDGEDD